MYIDDEEAIVEMVNSVLSAWSSYRDDHALELYKELISNCRIAYGTKADSELFSVINEMPLDAQFAFSDLRRRVAGTKFDLEVE